MSKGPLALVLVLALTSGYLAMRLHTQQRVAAFPTPPAHPLVKLAGLTQKQTRELDALQQQFVARRDPLRDKILARRAHIYELLQAKHPDQAKIDAEIEAITVLQAQMQREVAKHLLRVKALLTKPQQRQFFAALAVTMCPAAALGPGRPPWAGGSAGATATEGGSGR